MNSITQIGRLTKDPVLEYTQSNLPVCKFSIAVDGKTKDNPYFINWTVFDKQAENLCKYMSKGRQIAISGHQTSGKYQNREGKTIYKQDNIADRIEYLGNATEQKKSEPEQFDSFEQVYDDVPF